MLPSLILALALLPAQSSKVFLWEHSKADIAAAEINRFELRIDDGEWIDVGRMAHADQSAAEPGDTTYEAPVPALKIGVHTASVRPCNATECGNESTITFTISIRPGQSRLLRIGDAK